LGAWRGRKGDVRKVSAAVVGNGRMGKNAPASHQSTNRPSDVLCPSTAELKPLSDGPEPAGADADARKKFPARQDFGFATRSQTPQTCCDKCEYPRVSRLVRIARLISRTENPKMLAQSGRWTSASRSSTRTQSPRSSSPARRRRSSSSSARPTCACSRSRLSKAS
jgi:hypothetical protein